MTVECKNEMYEGEDQSWLEQGADTPEEIDNAISAAVEEAEAMVSLKRENKAYKTYCTSIAMCFGYDWARIHRQM